RPGAPALTDPDLSVVIPAYNEAERLPRSLARIVEFLRGWGGSYEVVVVDDGSTDGTAARIAESALVVRHDANRGKGHAVRTGMLRARGRRRLMTDADLSTPIEELPRLMARLDEGFGVVIASRAMEASRIEVRQPWYREGMGRLFNVFVRLIALPGLKDTQCGFKLFTAEAAADAFGPARLDGFSFDVETLFIAKKRGHRIAEVPVVWRNDAATRVGLWRGFVAFTDLLRIRVNDWAGRYDRGQDG
ncbi:MAG TPA: dolichyl-phosphate beta-glucosyltransferase, partial [Vicinamibacteria bacterium]|nr:dolichyl-phosphate beta-glucosyltransferase [Vicinamibacteria bacterium]